MPPGIDVVRVATPAEFVIAVPSGVSSSKFPFAFASRTNVTVWPALQAPETVAWRPTDVLGKYPVPVKRIPSGAGVMSVGRIAVRKGLDDVVALGARRPELVIDVVGSHSLWSDYRGLFASTSDNVRLLGHRPREAIYELLGHHAVLVQLSRYEPFGLTVIEALATGTPVVVTPAVGSSEGLDPMVCRVVAPGDIDALSVAVMEMTQRSSSPAIREAARREAEKFTPERVAGVLEAALVSVVV